MGETPERSRSGRRALVGSLAILAVATAVGFGRVFAGVAPTMRLTAAAAVSTGIAAILARRHLVLALAASAAGLLVVLGVLVYPETLWYGIPGPETVQAVAGSLQRLGVDAAREIAPAPPLRSLTTAALLAVWAAATAAHALAVRARSPVLALVPGAVLVAFAGVVTIEGPRPLFAILYLLGGFGVLFGASIDRLSTWGPLVERPGPHRLGGGTTGRWARRIGAVAAVLAVTIPGVLPGFGAAPLMTIKPTHPTRVSINPIVDIRPTLLQQPVAELFVVSAARPAYWRLLSLDLFDGRRWTSSDLLAEDGTIVGGTQLLGEPATGTRTLVQTFEIRSLSVPWLPAAYRPVEAGFDIDGDGGAARWDGEASVLATNDGTTEGDTYEIRSELVQPTPRELDRAYVGQPLSGVNGYGVADYLELPPMPDEVRTLLDRMTRGAGTPYRQALAIQDHLRSFEYDIAAPAGHGVNDIVFFLTQSRRGYCEQFAGTMAVLLRMLGIPSRVAVGFAPGARTDDGRWVVTTQDAHAWVEAYFPDHGWVAFEPTPTRTNPVARSYLSPIIPAPTESFVREREAQPPGGPRAEAGRQLTERGEERGTAGAAGGGPEADRPWPLWAVLALVAAAGFVALGLFRSAARRLVIASARSPAERILAAYRVFEASAADVGAGRRRGETLTEYADRIERDVLVGSRGLSGLTRLAAAVAYSTRRPGKADSDNAVALARRLVGEVRRRAGLGRSALGVARPAPPL